MEILEKIFKLIEDNPKVVLLKLTEKDARDLHDHLSKYHRADLPSFDEWIKSNSFYGRKVVVVGE